MFSPKRKDRIHHRAGLATLLALPLATLLALPLAGLLAGPLSGCGGAEPPPPATHRDFAAIQRFEATIHNAHGKLSGTCPERESAEVAICDASGQICAIASDTGDMDARARCARSREQCAEAQAGQCDAERAK